MPDGAVPRRADPAVVEILAELDKGRRTLPPKLFYDEAGCRLFGRITELDEYYVTRAETALLARAAGAIASHASPGSALVEYGASDEGKAAYLLGTGRFAAYVPIDIAAASLDAIVGRMATDRPGLPVHPVAADFLQALALPPEVGPKARFGFFPGSTIGNLEPASVVRFLSEAARTLRSDADPEGSDIRFAIGTDLRKDTGRLLAAYDDRDGVTAAFNRNILLHVNRIANADFEPGRFDHEARWNESEGRIEMHLVSRTAHDVRVAGRVFRFEAGQGIHTESSYKHTRDGFLALAASAGWRGVDFWTDPDGLFGVHLLEFARP